MLIRVARYCAAKTKRQLIHEVRYPKSQNYWNCTKYKGLIVGIYGLNVNLKQLNKNDYIGEGGIFYDYKNHETLNKLQRHIDMKLITTSNPASNEDYTINDIIDLHSNCGSYYLRSPDNNMWSFHVDDKDIIGYAGVRLVNNFVSDGVELRPKAKIYNIVKHEENEYLSELQYNDLMDKKMIKALSNLVKH